MILWSEGSGPGGSSLVQIRATDPGAGLLTRLTAVFERDGVDIAWAKVTTLGSSVVDVFNITTAGGDSWLSGGRSSMPSATSSSMTSYTVLPAPAPAKPVSGSRARLNGVFESLSDRLTGVLQGLRGKGRLTDADIDATTREIRLALLEADVSLPVVRDFVARIKDRAKGAEVSGALNPAQQVVKIVNDELVGILGGETRQLAFAKTPPTVIMLAGLQGAGKTTLAGKLAKWLRRPRAYAPAGRVRPAASRSGQPAADRWRTRRCAGLRTAPGCVDRSSLEQAGDGDSGRGRPSCRPGRGQGQAPRRRHRRHRPGRPRHRR